MQTYYRLHRNDSPCFCAEHAYSYQFGAEFGADGSQYRCDWCQGTGIADEDCPCRGHDPGCTRCDPVDPGIIRDAECHRCEGGGWADADRGYSCCEDPAALVAYIRHHVGEQLAAADGFCVIVFSGELEGFGTDEDERLVVPRQVHETLTWQQFAARIDS